MSQHLLRGPATYILAGRQVDRRCGAAHWSGAHPGDHRDGQDAVRRGERRVQGRTEGENHGPGGEILHAHRLLPLLQSGQSSTECYYFCQKQLGGVGTKQSALDRTRVCENIFFRENLVIPVL